MKMSRFSQKTYEKLRLGLHEKEIEKNWKKEEKREHRNPSVVYRSAKSLKHGAIIEP
jgi:hypothetical protein